MIDKQIIDEMIERIGFDVQQCGYLKIIKDALNYPEIGGTFTAFECNLYSRDCDFIERCRYKQLLRKEQELKNICKAFDIEYIIDKETGNLIGRCNKLYKKEQECEALQISDNEAVEIIAELKAYKDVNEDFKTAWEELKAENDELKKIVNEAKNSKLDLKSFLVGEAVQNEYEQQLDQLKAKNEELKKNLNEDCLQHLTLMTEQQVLLKTLAEIKEIAERRNYLDYNECLDDILQKISECEVKNDNK